VSTSTAPAVDGEVPWIAHDEFRQGLPHGRFRVVVNPALAWPLVRQRTHVHWVAMALIALGAALALAGQALPGAVLVVLGIGGHRVVKHQAAKIVLHLARGDAVVYREATQSGVMEVQRRSG
jgi:hypothetical protein